MVEFVVKFLVYLELEVGNLRGEEALGEYKRPPLPLISHIISFSHLPYAATLSKFYWYFAKKTLFIAILKLLFFDLELLYFKLVKPRALDSLCLFCIPLKIVEEFL